MQDYIDWFGRDSIDFLLADREFVGDAWLGFLNSNHIRYHIRIRNNFKVLLPHKQVSIKVPHLFNRSVSTSVGTVKGLSTWEKSFAIYRQPG